MSSPCDTCPEPRHCCQAFTLSHDFALGTTTEEAGALVRQQGQPFEAKRLVLCKNGDLLLTVSCPWLTDEGRCGSYAQRPALCRDYTPGSNGLCVLGP